MIKIRETDNALKSLSKFDPSIKRLYSIQKKRIMIDTRDSRLHVKKIVDVDDVYSFRITRSYRALFYFQKNTVIVIFAIGHRKDIYS